MLIMYTVGTSWSVSSPFTPGRDVDYIGLGGKNTGVLPWACGCCCYKQPLQPGTRPNAVASMPLFHRGLLSISSYSCAFAWGG